MIKYSPIRIILDAFRRVPNNLEIFKNVSNIPVWIFTSIPINEKINQESIDLGVKIINVNNDRFGYGVNLKQVFSSLSGNGIMRVLVESGGNLSSALMNEKLIDRLVIYRAPSVIGGDGMSAIESINVSSLSDRLQFKLIRIEEFDENIIETYKVL